MIQPVQPPDRVHLQAAEGWIGLDDFTAAAEELERISQANQAVHGELIFKRRLATQTTPGKDSLWSMDLFRTESILLRSHWVLVVMDQFTRRIIGFGVQSIAVDGPGLCRMFNQAISGNGLPTKVSTDHDPLFQFCPWQANLRILDLETVQTVPQVPWSHPFIERLIGTIRRKYLDHLFFWTADDLERKLESFKNYYNAARVHQGLSGDTPDGKAGGPKPQAVGLENYCWQSHSTPDQAPDS